MTKVLFIGNSHTYFNDLPGIFKKLCRDKGKEVHVAMLCKGGMGLDWHMKEPQTRFNILYGQYDYVVLQHTAHSMGDFDLMRAGAEALVKWAKEAGSTPVFYQTLAKKGDESFQPFMSGVYDLLGRELNCPVAPVGNAWQKHRLSHPEEELYFTDGEHASPLGSPLAARVIMETNFPDTAE